MNRLEQIVGDFYIDFYSREPRFNWTSEKYKLLRELDAALILCKMESALAPTTLHTDYDYTDYYNAAIKVRTLAIALKEALNDG